MAGGRPRHGDGKKHHPMNFRVNAVEHALVRAAAAASGRSMTIEATERMLSTFPRSAEAQMEILQTYAESQDGRCAATREAISILREQMARRDARVRDLHGQEWQRKIGEACAYAREEASA